VPRRQGEAAANALSSVFQHDRAGLPRRIDPFGEAMVERQTSLHVVGEQAKFTVFSPGGRYRLVPPRCASAKARPHRACGNDFPCRAGGCAKVLTTKEKTDLDGRFFCA